MMCPACARRDPPKEVVMKPTYLALYDFQRGSPMADVIECPLCGYQLNVNNTM